MKIAVSTSDGKTVCGHLSKCSQFIIYEADGFDIIDRCMRRTDNPGACHTASGSRVRSTAPFDDCQAVISQGMGQGIYDGLVNRGIIPVLTSETDPEVAVRQFLCGGMTGAYQGNCSCGDH